MRFASGPLRGRFRMPGDKSISHRALIIGALASGTTTVANLNEGADVAATRDALRQLGLAIDVVGPNAIVKGGMPRDPSSTIDCRNSGTSARMLIGVCAGCGTHASFDGDVSLRRRPMERVARPLREIGARIETTDGRMPVRVRGTYAPGNARFTLEVPSAQIKSALLLAHVRAQGPIRIEGDRGSRDHTERMLEAFGADIAWTESHVDYRPGPLRAQNVDVPGDLSAAAFFLVAAAGAHGSDVVLEEVGVNPTRAGILDILLRMGVSLSVTNERSQSGEPVADIRVRASDLHGIDIDEGMALRAIDEIPVVAVAAALARGSTTIEGIGDLRNKESDRIATVAALLRACGAEVEEFPGALRIRGGTLGPQREVVATHDDHRIAMAAAALAAAHVPIEIDSGDSVAVSFPGFLPVWNEAQGNRTAGVR